MWRDGGPQGCSDLVPFAPNRVALGILANWRDPLDTHPRGAWLHHTRLFVGDLTFTSPVPSLGMEQTIFRSRVFTGSPAWRGVQAAACVRGNGRGSKAQGVHGTGLAAKADTPVVSA